MLTTNVACRYSFIYVFFQFKFSYKKLPVYEGGIAQSCRSRLISCWEQCMEEVEIEYCTGKQYEDGNYSVPGKDVKRYIVKGDYIWKKIVSLTELSTPLDDYWFFFFWLIFCLILEGFEREMSLFDQDIYSVEDHIVIIK